MAHDADGRKERNEQMPRKRSPIHEETFGDGVRVRVYGVGLEYHCLIGDTDLDDPYASVWYYPKLIGPIAAAHQAFLDNERD